MGSELWQRLREARRRAGLRQQDVADHCEIDRAAVSQWEAANPGKRTRPSNENLRRFQSLTGAPWDWLQSDAASLDADWRTEALLHPTDRVGARIRSVIPRATPRSGSRLREYSALLRAGHTLSPEQRADLAAILDRFGDATDDL